MKTNWMWGVGCLVSVGISGCMKAPVATMVQDTAPAVSTEQVLRNNIEFHQQRVAGDPKGAIGWAMLSEAQLELAREKDDDQAAQEAEKAARMSLEVREIGNSRAARRLTEALLHQHRFVDAEESARLCLKLKNDDASVRLLGDVLLELGKYGEFKTLTSKSINLWQTPDGAAMLARWYEVIGQPERSLDLLKDAVQQVEKAGPAQSKAAAWYRTQFGWTSLRYGRTSDAKASFEQALRDNATDRKAIYGLAQIAYNTGNFKTAAEKAWEANNIVPMTDALGLEAMSLQKLGDEKGVKVVLAKIRTLNQFESAGRGHTHSHGADHGRHTHNRLFAAFLANFGTDLRDAHHMAEEDLQWRKDIHAYDTFAWATYQFWKLDPAAKREEGNGLLREAQAAIRKATNTGTKDPVILSHAQEILGAKP